MRKTAFTLSRTITQRFFSSIFALIETTNHLPHQNNSTKNTAHFEKASMWLLTSCRNTVKSIQSGVTSSSIVSLKRMSAFPHLGYLFSLDKDACSV